MVTEASKVVFLTNPEDVRAVRACYEPDGKTGLFKTFDAAIKEGDMVVVQSDTRHKMTTAKITEIDADVDFNDDEKIKWVIGSIDLDAYNLILEGEARAIKASRSAQLARQRKQLADDMALDANMAIDLKALQGVVTD